MAGVAAEVLVCGGADSPEDNPMLLCSGEGCDAGHTGPLCEWCTSETQFFDRAERGCTDCPSTVVRFGILTGAVAAAAGAARQ